MHAKGRSVRRAIVAIVAAAGMFGVALGLMYFSGSAALCGTCHEMRGKVDSWKVSSHTRVACSGCHESPKAWYDIPGMLTQRVNRISRDLSAHGVFAERAIAKPVASTESTSSVPDSICLGCHELGRKITMKYGTVFDHEAHAKRNKSCLSCHLETAHPEANAERPLLLMSRCFTCHGQEPGAKAPGKCTTCHPKSFSLRPQSHTPDANWKKAHGKVSLTNRKYCGMCHAESFCSGCHGLQMPHPATWATGKSGHATFPAAKRYVCAQCHNSGPNFCSMCHHQGFQPTKGSWVSQHPTMVRNRGASMCFDCHSPTFCSRCHVNGGTPPPGAKEY